MFTGIVECNGMVEDILESGTNRSFWISSPISHELKVDQSICHNGVCLTIEAINGSNHRVTAIDETLQKTNLGEWRKGTAVNLERSLRAGDRLDGHLVQGHVDCKGICLAIKEKDGSHEYTFEIPKKFAELVIEKGSVSLNGISLTCFDVKKKSFRVAIIPYTFDHTNMKSVKAGDSVNIEFDMAGKYILRRQSLED